MPLKTLAALLTTAFLTSATLGAQSLPGENPPWNRLDTAHFIFLSQLDESSTRSLAADLEHLRAVLEKLAPDRQLSSPNLTYIYLFADYDSFLPFQLRVQGKPTEGVSHFTPHPHANYAALNADPALDPNRFLYSQYVHQLLNEQLPQLPLWFRQGLAEFYSTYQRDPKGAKIGLAAIQHLSSYGYAGGLQLVENGAPDKRLEDPYVLSMAKILAMTRAPADPFERNFYLSRCWAAVHYLLNDTERRDQTLQFIQKVVLGEDSATAFSQAFSMSPEQLEKRVFEYVRRSEFPHMRVVMSVEPMAGALFRPLPRHEALFFLGDLLLHSAPDRRLDAANYLERALASARSMGIDHGPSHAALGEVAELGGDMEAASRSYALAVEHAGGDALVHFLYGQSLLATLGQQRPADDDAKQRLSDAIAALEESTAARPEFAEAWSSLGFAYGLQESPSGDDEAALTRALELLPGRTDIALNLLLSHAKKGQRSAADGVYRRLQWMGASETEMARADELLLQMDYREANRLVRKDNNLADAVALFARIQAKSQNPALRERAAERIAKFSDAMAHNRFAELYVQAVRQLRTGAEGSKAQLDGVLDELQSLAKPGLQTQAVKELRLQHQGAQP